MSTSGREHDKPHDGTYLFASFELDLNARKLRKGGAQLDLAGQPFQVLTALVERHGQLVTSAELKQRLWSATTFIEFNVGIDSAIRNIRQALGDSAESPRFVETVPREGYRFIATVKRSEPPKTKRSPERVSRYSLDDKLGEGAMGVVYRATDDRLQRPVALKFISSQADASGEAQARFQREARAAAQLSHPNICTVYEIDETADGQAFIAMELMEGETLEERIEKGLIDLEDAIEFGTQAAQGLAAAHEKGVVHRDIKPANIMLTPFRPGQPLVKIMDFGLARFVAAETQLTQQGTTLGTAAYMSPEQVEGLKPDRRCDVWALGVVMYQMVSGRLPFGGTQLAELAYEIVSEGHEPLSAIRAGVSKDLDQIVDKALEKSPDDRYQHIGEMLVDLHGIEKVPAPAPSEPAPVPPTPAADPAPQNIKYALVGAALAALVTAGLFILVR